MEAEEESTSSPETDEDKTRLVIYLKQAKVILAEFPIICDLIDLEIEKRK